MSLHAQLSPEALARLEAQRRNSTISSLVIAFLSLTLLGLILGFILLPSLFKETPTIVTYAASLTQETDLDQKKVNNSPDRRPSAPSSSMAKVIAANTTSSVAIPVPDVNTPVPSVNFGDGDDFGTGWGSGGDGGGGGGGFGNVPATMKKRCSKADRLARLKDTNGTPECEDAVVKSLQWLKRTQSGDGSWAGGPAMTGFALLAYLGHCETPLSEEFGDSCLRAITSLVNLGMKNNGKLSDGAHLAYEHGIATYALAEAATFCKQLNINVPNLQEVTQKAGQFIIDNQHASGGWEYKYEETGDRGGDLSISAWQIQAIKACKHTGLDFRNMSKCINRATEYVERLSSGNGGFGYSRPNDRGGAYYTLSGAGVLCLQLWDKGSRGAARDGAKYIDKNTSLDYNAKSGDLYCHYYEAQAMMNRGGEQWKRYNNLFREQLLKNQNADGSFKTPGGGMQMNTHYATCLATLMLEVYYRFLPGTGGGAR
jgi:hypothetical protein